MTGLVCMTMERAVRWVALLDEDEDDFVFWQYGFNSWSDQLRLQCFRNMDEFWAECITTGRHPAFILMADLSPSGEEKNRLQNCLDHECCQEAKIFLFTDLIREDEYAAYRELGATDCFGCPSTLAELQQHILCLSRYPVS